jgi:hypothetical protein
MIISNSVKKNLPAMMPDLCHGKEDFAKKEKQFDKFFSSI